MKKTFTLMRAGQRDRRYLLRGAVAAAGSAFLAGCDKLSQNQSFVATLQSAEHLSRAAQKVVAPRPAMAQEFGPDQVAQTFRGNGTLSPRDDDYVALRDAGFADYRLTVGGLVAKPAEFTLEELRAMPSRTQITRHDCVEGWSCVGKWKGVQLARILDQVQIKPEAKFVLFRCFDSMEGPSLDDRDSRYYESIDLDDAHHVQTILAYELNDRALPVTNGAPLRCRVERQLGYKQAKYVRAIELVESFAQIRGGKGGYWEDEGYEWYGGI
ncbi:MAG TPA: molybdopterin-binding protein [Caldimonas sp.]|jgi:DMSO/TMAO reductase YedYZ molybdopterin-dependent catalytic subunit